MKNFLIQIVLIYLDIPIKISLERLQERSLQEIYETEAKLTQVKKTYQQIIDKYQDLSLVIDGTQAQQDINQQIIDFINQKFKSVNPV